MPAKECILTFDIGTTGNKCSLFDLKGRTLAFTTSNYKSFYPRPGWAEQDPEDYWCSVIRGSRQLAAMVPELIKRVVGISLSGHMNGMLPIDRDGNPVCHEIIHSDNRSHAFCHVIRQRIPDYEFFSITGNRIDSHLSLSKILWFRHEYPDLYRKTESIIQSKDFIAGRLTGTIGSTDMSDASLTCVLNLKKRKWSSSVISEFGLDKEKFPRLLQSHDRVGALSIEAADLLGLKMGIPVFAGGGDAACSLRGAGIGNYQTAQNYIGSSSWISQLAPEPFCDREMRIQNFIDLNGRDYHVCGTVQSAGIALDWMMDEIALRNSSGERDDYRSVETMAESSGIGAKGLFFLPYLMGERTPYWNQNLKGIFAGLSLGHSRSDIMRSVFEGVCYALRDVLEVFKENTEGISELSLTGGGASSPFWNVMMSEVYGKPVKIPAGPEQVSSLGAAIAAFVGLGIYASYQDAVKEICFDRYIQPDSDRVEKYDKCFSVYRNLYPSAAEQGKIISEYQNRFL